MVVADNTITIPVVVTVIIPRTKVILGNPVVSVEVLNTDILRVKHHVDLIEPNQLRPIIVDEDNCLQHEPPLMMTARKAFLPAGDSALQATHSPLACLPKQCVHEQIIADVAMQTSRSPFCDGTDEGAVRVTAPGEPLVNAYLVISNFFFSACKNCAVNAPSAQLPGKLIAAKNNFPSGPYANTLLTIVSQSYPQKNAFCSMRSSVHSAGIKTPSIKPMTSFTIGALNCTMSANCLIFTGLGNFTCTIG